MDYIYKNKTSGRYIISKQWGNISHEDISSFDIFLALKFNNGKNLAFFDLVYFDDCERISYDEELKNIRKNKLLKIKKYSLSLPD